MSGWDPNGGWAMPPDTPVAPAAAPGPFSAPGYAAPPHGQAEYPPAPPTAGAPVGPPVGPPGPVPHAVTGKAHMLGTLSVVLALTLTAAIFTQLYAASAVAGRAELIDELRLVNSIDETLLDRVEEVNAEVDVAAGLSGLSWLVCGATWILWQRRFVRNASRFGPISPSLIWGTLGWFAPIAGYFLPQSQLANAARQTDPHQLLGRSGMAPPVLYVWWVLFGAAHLTSLAARLTGLDAATAVIQGGFSIGSYQRRRQARTGRPVPHHLALDRGRRRARRRRHRAGVHRPAAQAARLPRRGELTTEARRRPAGPVRPRRCGPARGRWRGGGATAPPAR